MRESPSIRYPNYLCLRLTISDGKRNGNIEKFTIAYKKKSWPPRRRNLFTRTKRIFFKYRHATAVTRYARDPRVHRAGDEATGRHYIQILLLLQRVSARGG